MTHDEWEREREARILARILLLLENQQRLLELILHRLPPPPRFRPTVGIIVRP